MRRMEEIQKDYQVQASIAGDTQYKIFALQKDLLKMNLKLRELNKEALKLQAAQQASAAAEAKADMEAVAGDDADFSAPAVEVSNE